MAPRSDIKALPQDLPELPNDWTYLTLVQLVDEQRGICYGIVQPGSAQKDGVPILRVNNVRSGQLMIDDVMRVAPDIESKYSRSRLRGGEVVLTLVGSLGESAVVPKSIAGWNVARAVGVIPISNESDTRWVELCLRSPLLQHYIHIWATTTVQATFNLRDVARLPVPMPPEPERQAIACILGALDDKIEVNRRMNGTLEAMARALFQDWFVDFGPVRAKAAGQAPAGLSEAVAGLFPDQLVEVEGREVPEGWEIGTLGDIAQHPRRSVRPDQIDQDTPYIALEHMPKRCIALSEWGTADGVESNKYEFRTGEILFGKLRPYFHKVGVAPLDGVCSTDIVVVAPQAQHWFGLVLGHLSSDAFVEYTNAFSAGTKMPRTNWGDMSRYEIVVPSTEIAQAYTDQVEPAVKRIATAIHESRKLAALRDALLPKLIAGEVRVADAERVVGRCL